jgi:mono/diheme cytochrome c family protein
MRTLRPLLLSFGGAIAITLVLGTAASAASSVAGPDEQDKQARPQPARNGEQLFQTNCSRCHQAPESFSPSISGTILRHMRVRASLSREDERAILKYLNP